jgi:hypothetical protein
MAAFVTLHQAKEHLRIHTTDTDPDVYLKVEHASGIVLDYLKSRGDATWNSDTAPAPVQAATLLVLGHLHENRGDDMEPDANLWMAIERVLMRSRDPALA